MGWALLSLRPGAEMSVFYGVDTLAWLQPEATPGEDSKTGAMAFVEPSAAASPKAAILCPLE